MWKAWHVGVNYNDVKARKNREFDDNVQNCDLRDFGRGKSSDLRWSLEAGAEMRLESHAPSQDSALGRRSKPPSLHQSLVGPSCSNLPTCRRSDRAMRSVMCETLRTSRELASDMQDSHRLRAQMSDGMYKSDARGQKKGKGRKISSWSPNPKSHARILTLSPSGEVLV